MAVSGTISQGWIQIGLKGFEAAKTHLAALQTQANKITSGLSQIGGTFKTGFAMATGSIIGLLKAADPVRFEIFTQKLQILAMYIGITFIPLLKDAIRWVDRMIAYFKNLSNEQRGNILHWTKIGLAILAVGSALATVGAVIGKVISLLGSLWSIISGAYGIIRPLITTLGKILPIGRIVKLLTLAFMLFRGEGEKVGGVFARLQRAIQPVLESAWNLVKKLIDIFVKAGSIVGDVADSIFGKMGSGLLSVFEAALPLIETCLNMVKSILDAIAGALDYVLGVVNDARDIYEVISKKGIIGGTVAWGQGLARSAVSEAEDTVAGALDWLGLPGSGLVRGVGSFARGVIGGEEDDAAIAAEREAREARERGEGDWEGGSGSGGSFDDAGDEFAPLREFKRVEQFGIEDAFKRAQQGASFDPSRLSAFERQQLAQGGKLEELLQGIYGNTTRRPEAVGMF